MNLKSLLVAIIASFLALFSRVGAKLTQVPRNTEALVGDSVRLQCFTENKNYPPSWSHIKVGSQEPSDVYMTVKSGHDMIVGRMTVEYYARFKVIEDLTTGEYSLEITGVQLGDAGRYICTARGGLGQHATAELGVIEAPPHCASNITEAIGENVCNLEPDHIGLSCSFRYNGNDLPSVHWVRADEPGRVVRTEKARRTGGDRGLAVSHFFLRADAGDLNGSSFMCIISSRSRTDDQRISCTTPVIKVLKIAHSTELRTLVQPEEVHCNPLPHLTKTGCRWLKRNLGEDSTETFVTDGSLLNLYRPEFDSGIYVCIVGSNIRGQPCSVEALTINYERAEPGESVASSSTSKLVIILTVVLTVVAALAITVLLLVIWRKHVFKGPGRSEEQQQLQTTPSGSTGSSIDDKSNEAESPREAESPTGGSSAGSSNDVNSGVKLLSEDAPHTGGSSDSGISSEETPPTEDEPLKAGDVAVDMPDAKAFGKQGEPGLRNRLIEEKALARMRQNAASRQGTDNPGFPGDGDVAEGISHPAEKSKDE